MNSDPVDRNLSSTSSSSRVVANPSTFSRHHFDFKLLPILFSVLQTDCRDSFLTPHHQIESILNSLGFLHLQPNPSEHSFSSFLPSTLPVFERLPDSTVAKRLLKSPTTFHETTQMTINEFLIIYEELEPALLRSSSNLSLGEFERDSSQKVPIVDALVLWVMHSDGASCVVLSLLMDEVDRRGEARVVDNVTQAINLMFESELGIGDREERESLYGTLSVHEKAIGVLDGNHMSIEVRSGEEEMRYYSGHRRSHTQNYLVLVNSLSFFLSIDGPFPGRMNDRVWNNSKMKKEIEEALAEDEWIIVEGGFYGEGPFIVPYTQLELNACEDMEEMKKMELINNELTLNRSLVEDNIHKLKSRARVLLNKFRRKKDKQFELVTAAARLENRLRRIRLDSRLQTHRDTSRTI